MARACVCLGTLLPVRVLKSLPNSIDCELRLCSLLYHLFFFFYSGTVFMAMSVVIVSLSDHDVSICV